MESKNFCPKDFSIRVKWGEKTMGVCLIEHVKFGSTRTAFYYQIKKFNDCFIFSPHLDCITFCIFQLFLPYHVIWCSNSKKDPSIIFFARTAILYSAFCPYTVIIALYGKKWLKNAKSKTVPVGTKNEY